MIPAILLLALQGAPPDGNRLAYLDGNDPYYVHRGFPKLVTPQWVGEEGVEAVVVLAIDDMRGHEKWEAYLRPILERLKRIDGRAPVSIMTCSIDPNHAHLKKWLQEGLSLEIHTVDHPCPILKDGDLAKAKSTYDRCVDLLRLVPGNRPVAFRVPCCDSLNTPTPRFYAEIFNRTTPNGGFLTIDTSVFNIITPRDPALPRELTTDPDGQPRFAKYVPGGRSFVNTVEDYPYPYVIGRLCWQFPCVTPSDWQAQFLHKPDNPRTVEDLKAALDATVIKQGVFNLVFHPHGWIRSDQVVELIDHAVAKHGEKVKFLNFREAQERLDRHLLGGHPLRAADGRDNGVRILDLDNDGYMDVLVANDRVRQTRLWSPKTRSWSTGELPVRSFEAVRFGALLEHVVMLLRTETEAGAWWFSEGRWDAETELLKGLEDVRTAEGGRDRGVRLRDVDNDGYCEVLVANEKERSVYRWSGGWKNAGWNLPPGTRIVDAQGRDAGTRFVDVNGDGLADLLHSDDERFSLHLFTAGHKGWETKIREGRRGDAGEFPAFVRGGTNNGAWFHSNHLWVQNEDTAKMPNHVDRRSFEDLLKTGGR